MRIYPNPEKLAESEFQTLINQRNRFLLYLLREIIRTCSETADKVKNDD